MFYFAYESSDLFAMPTANSIYSLLKNIKCEDVEIFIISKDFSKANFNIIKNMIAKIPNINVKLTRVELPDLSKTYGFHIFDYGGKWNVDSFGKLILCDLLPKYVDKVLYLDSDTLVMQDISGLMEMNLDGKMFGAVMDFISSDYFSLLGLNSDKGIYCNTGMILENLTLCREFNIATRINKYLDQTNGVVFFSEQSVFNVVFQDEIKVLPLAYNLTTIPASLTWKQIKMLRNPHNSYTCEEINESLKNPFIIHFTSFFLIKNRPWINNCNHPFTKDYLNSFNESAIKFLLWNDNRRFKKKMIDFCMSLLPTGFVCWLVGKYYSKGRINKFKNLSRGNNHVCTKKY